MQVTHVEFAEANAFVVKHHRHHRAVQGYRFAIGALKDGGEGVLVGVSIVGRPVAPKTDQRMTVEVTRLCVVDGVKNSCSFLYGASARAAKALGYTKIQTFILDTESGISLKAAGWTCEGPTAKGSWANRKGRNLVDHGQTIRWSLVL